MDTKALIDLINEQIIGLTKHIEHDISQLSYSNDENEKLKAQKCLVDNLHKITNTILQIKRFEKSQEGTGSENPEKDKLILAEYIKKFHSS